MIPLAITTTIGGLPASVAPSARRIVAGAGLTGGGDLSADRTFDVVALDTSVDVQADGIRAGLLVPYVCATRAAISAIASPINLRSAYCIEVDAWYQLDTSSVATANGWSVLTAPAGRWVLTSSSITLSPAAGGADNGPTVQDAAQYAPLKLKNGTWAFATRCRLYTRAHVEGESMTGTIIVSTIAPSGTGSPTAAVFYAAPADSIITPISLSSAIVPGSADALAKTIRPTSLTDGTTTIVAGMGIAVYQNNNKVNYTVISTGAGPTIVVDREITQPFSSAAQVTDSVMPEDIYLANMTGRGTGDAFWEFSSCKNARVVNVVVESGFTLHPGNFDVGCVGPSAWNCTLAGGQNCINVESTERALLTGIHCTGASGYGIYMTAGFGGCVIDCDAYKCGASGLGLSAGFSANGVQAYHVDGFTAVHGAGTGIELLNGASSVTLHGCKTRYNGSTGYYCNSGGTGVVHDIHFTDCESESDQSGFYVSTGGYGVTANGCSAHRSTTYGFAAQGDFRLSNFASTGCVNGALYAYGAGLVTAINGKIVAPATGSFNAIREEGTASASLSHVDVDLTGAGSNALLSAVGTGTIRTSNVKTTAGTYGFFANAGATIIRGPNTDVTSISTGNQVLLSGGSVETYGSIGEVNFRKVAAIPAGSATSGPIMYADPTSGNLSLREQGGQTVVLTNGGSWSVTAVKTTTYTAAAGELVRCDPSSAGFTVNLPTAASIAGRSICVKNTTTSTNAITLDGSGAETIDGAATQAITTARGSVGSSMTITSDGTNWMITG